MIETSCPVCQQPIVDQPVKSGDVVCCAFCGHRLKFKGGELVNLGVDASGEASLVGATVSDLSEKQIRSRKRKGQKKREAVNAEEIQGGEGDDELDLPVHSEAEENMLQALSQPAEGNDPVRARQNARQNRRRHQQTAVLWLLAGTIFVVLGVGFIVISGPERFSNIYRPKQLADMGPGTGVPEDQLDHIADGPLMSGRVEPDAVGSRGRLASGRQAAGKVTRDGNGESRGTIFTTGMAVKDYPPVDAQPLYPSPWREPSEPFVPYDGLTQISLQNDAIISEEHGQRRYIADLVYDGQDTIESLTIFLGLVDRDGRVIARMSLPLGLLNYTRPQRINVTIPQVYAERTHRVIWAADIGRKLAGGIPIGQIAVRPTGSEGDAALLIHAVNPVNLPVGRVSFLLVAHNNQGQPVMRWRVDWDKGVAPSQGFYLKAVTPVQRVWAAKHWVAMGVAYPGLPAAAMPAP